jgi:hypothetical protein
MGGYCEEIEFGGLNKALPTLVVVENGCSPFRSLPCWGVVMTTEPIRLR